MKEMPVRLSTTTVSNSSSLPKSTNAALMTEFYHYMKNNGTSESHTNNSLNTNMALAKFLGLNFSFYDVKRKEHYTLLYF
jgi:predicted AAA+ superfamily ATPase